VSDTGARPPEEPTVVDQPPAGEPDAPPASMAARFEVFTRAGGLVIPIVTTLLAFFVAGLVVLVTTRHNPLSTYWAIFNGTGLTWFFHPGSYSIGLPFSDARVWFPLNTNSLPGSPGFSNQAYALQQTLLYTTTLIFTGLAVAFAFRCGLFNIGGQGQYVAGSLAAVWVGSSLAGTGALPHTVLAVAAAGLAGALLAGIAGILKATVGAHEVVVLDPVGGPARDADEDDVGLRRDAGVLAVDSCRDGDARDVRERDVQRIEREGEWHAVKVAGGHH